MIHADIILVGEGEPFVSAVFDQAPAVGDRIWVQEKPASSGRVVEVDRRNWTAMTFRPSPNNVVALYVRDVTEAEEMVV